MFIKVFRYIFVRILALILFFNDYKVLSFCFTILLSLIFALKSIEEGIFSGEYLSLVEVFKKVSPFIILYLLFLVSQGLFFSVQKTSTNLFMFLLLSILIPVQLYAVCLEKSEKLEKVRSFIDKNIEVEGIILSREGDSRYTLKSSGSSIGDVILKMAEYSVIQTGETCLVSGKLVEPESFDDFDYKKYLFRKGIYSILEVSSYKCLDEGNRLLLLRSRIERSINRNLPEPESSLLAGIIFGSERVFTKDFSNSLQASGLSHIVSASGYNVALLASFIDKIFGKVKGKALYILKISVIWMFALFSGFSSSIVRASTMSSIYFFSILLGRDVSKGVLILFCITSLVVLNPFIIYDIGFLLSSSATIGLIFFPKCFKCKSLWIKDSFLPTFTCALFTLPVVIYFFGKISVISIIANLITAPIIQSTIYWGILSIIFPFLYFITYIQLNIFRYVVEISGNINPINIQSNVETIVYILIFILLLFCIIKYPLTNENYYLKKSKNILKYNS